MVVSCAVVFVPIFFAGIVFGTLFRDSSKPDVDFGSNIAGAVLGGLCESLSLVVGFNHLLVIAVVCYLLSAIPNRKPLGSLCRLLEFGPDSVVFTYDAIWSVGAEVAAG